MRQSQQTRGPKGSKSFGFVFVSAQERVVLHFIFMRDATQINLPVYTHQLAKLLFPEWKFSREEIASQNCLLGRWSKQMVNVLLSARARLESARERTVIVTSANWAGNKNGANAANWVSISITSPNKHTLTSSDSVFLCCFSPRARTQNESRARVCVWVETKVCLLCLVEYKSLCRPRAPAPKLMIRE